ncbi:two-component system histidine kinase PnpS [Cytobacillus purgationiresistens]|uniref:histidine kinase n=1 Tax=Cytobacillus purgationiresistens TaxID=863449 RepID=A0ABU0AFQ3_9BACI|nr:ATP-binding protein [Cytobacillus purgationiresistens]MDQ0270085.1 two-component system phosphate regulon sensor histidine kinase PhoR [Cytobacillus purgationiresistens]
MKIFRSKLFFALITLILAVLICLGLLLGQLFKSYYIQVFDERLKKETDMLSNYIGDLGGIQSLTADKVKGFSDTLGLRVTIAANNAAIEFDSGKTDPIQRHEEIIAEIIAEDEKSLNAKEIGGGYDYHYYWKPIIASNGDGQEGYIFLSAKMDELENAYQQIWWILIICLTLALVIIIFLGSSITSRYTKPIEAATRVAIELAKGNYRARTYDNNLAATGKLSSSINILARNLQDMVKSQEMHQDRLSTLIENMGSGLILIDSKGYINLVNRTYKEVFHTDSAEYINELYYDVIDHKEVTDLIEEIFMTEHKVRKQLLIPIGIERKHFEVYGVPIIGMNDVWKGVLLVFHDISEIKKLEQIRRDFVANVSHELKTPITSIKGFSETLLDGAMEDKEALNQFLKIILQESERLQTLIQDLLDLSKIEQQGFSLSIEKFDLLTVINEVIAIVNRKAEEKNITISIEKEKETILIEADPYRMKQVFINIVSNAISYTPNGGIVAIKIAGDDAKVLIEIEDTGIGIEQEEIPRIFERFYRVDRARSRNSGGTGLGLAIVKHLVEAHKGLITVKSEIGKGTVFHIELNKEFIDK